MTTEPTGRKPYLADMNKVHMPEISTGHPSRIQQDSPFTERASGSALVNG